MTIIFAKHDGCDKEFIFEVPAGMYPVRNDVLWVDTAFGHGIEEVITRLEAYLPLKKVKAYANRELQTYIENRAYREVGAFCQDRQASVYELEEVPF